MAITKSKSDDLPLFINAVSKADNEYYINDSSDLLTDAEYDTMKKMVNNYKVGVNIKATGFQKIQHNKKMLSLDNIFSEADFFDFINKINHFFGKKNEKQLYEFTVEPKIDGISFSALYESGKLVHVATRGDYSIGEDITENVKTIANFPITLAESSTWNVPNIIEVRGEIYMTHEHFANLNKEQENSGGKIFSNPRNATSGSLRQLDAAVTASRKLEYIVHGIGASSTTFATQGNVYKAMQEFGFKVNDFAIFSEAKDIFAFFDNYEKRRMTIPFDIDGIVYKINDINLQNRLGETGIFPRWAVAHKFSSIKAYTKIVSIEIQVGRTGVITPVANLIPINIGGVIIKRATLHNFDEIIRLGVNSGDIVEIERAGDVIPKILAITEKISSNIYETPKLCPSCNSILTKEDIFIRCNNSEFCKDQILQRLTYFVSKNGLDIIGLGEKQIEEFYNKGLIESYVDIFDLPQLLIDFSVSNWAGWGKLSVQNLINSINQIKEIHLFKFICALSIPGVGESASKIIAEYYLSIENIIQDIQNEFIGLKRIDGIGDKIIAEILRYFVNKENIINIIKLSKRINIININNSQKINGTIIFTGKFKIVSRKEAKILAEKNGYKIASTISRNIDLLICGDSPSSKLKHAQDFGIKIINENDFLQLMNFNR